MSVPLNVDTFQSSEEENNLCKRVEEGKVQSQSIFISMQFVCSVVNTRDAVLFLVLSKVC